MGRTKYSDEFLVESLQSGNKSEINLAFNYLYNEYFELINNLVVNYSRDNSLSRDVFQETMVIVYRSILDNKFKGKSSLKTYVYSIAKNVTFGLLKKLKSTIPLNELELELLDDNLSEQQFLDDQRSRSHKIALLLKKLQGNCKEVLTDFYYRGFTMTDIQDKYNLSSIQAAKTKKYRCLKKLTEHFDAKGLLD